MELKKWKNHEKECGAIFNKNMNNKSKFKSVKWNGYELQRYQQTLQWCILDYKSCGGFSILFHENIIEQFPELFEIEKFQQLKEGKYYKVKMNQDSEIEIVQYKNGFFKRIGISTEYCKDYFEIIEEIK